MTSHAKDNRHDESLKQCMRDLLQALDWGGEERQILEATTTASRTFDIHDMLNAMANLGYRARPIPNMRAKHIAPQCFPCVFIPHKKKHPPRVLKDAISEGLKGTLYHFEKLTSEADSISQNDATQSINQSWFKRVLNRFSSIFWQVFVIGIMLNLFALAVPIFMMLVYDQVIGSHAPETLDFLIIGAALAIVMECVMRVLRSKSLSWFGARIDNIVGNAVFARLLFLPPSYTANAPVSAQIARLKTFESVRDFFSGPLLLTLLDLPFVLVLIVAIAFIGGPLALIPVIVMVLYALLYAAFWPALNTRNQTFAQKSAERRSMIVETFSKIRALRFSGAEKSWKNRFHELSGQASYAGFRSTFMASVMESITHTGSIIAGVATIYFGVHMVWSGELSSGGMIACLILIWRTLMPMQMTCTMLPRLQQVKGSIDQVNRLMKIQPEREPHLMPTRFPEFVGKITFENVGLRYSKDTDPIFSGLSFTAHPGEMVAITGTGGSGQSTILKIILGLNQPQMGSVLIDNTDIRQLDQIELRRHLSYAPQSPHFFTGTIEQNLRYCDPSISDEDMHTALRRAGALKEVEALPDGLQTIIDPNHEHNMSSHLIYRLGLARMHIQPGSVLLMDELPHAFISSDESQEHYKFLKNAKGTTTMIMVTHQQELLSMADIVIELQSGMPPKVIRNTNPKQAPQEPEESRT